MPENASDSCNEAPEELPVAIRFGALSDLGFDLQFDDEHFDDEDPAILAMVALA